jgi:hypothetical protein
MARPLPRYQESGLISADVPRLDFASFRESQAFGQTITSSLDKLSQFAFGKVRAEQEARNKIVGIQLRGDYEAEVQRRFAELTALVETGQLSDFGQIQEEVRALSGYASKLAEVSPEQANGLMTNINAGGRALLAKSSDILVKAYGAQVDQTTDQMISDVGANLKTVFDVADSEATAIEYVNAVRGTVFSVAANNPATTKTKMENFELAVRSARNASLVDYFSSKDFAANPYDALQKLRSNDGGLRTDIWRKMPEDQRQKVIDTVLSRQADNLQAIERADKLAREATKVETINDYDSYYLGEISGDDLIARMRSRGYTPGSEELLAIRQGDHSGASLQLVGALEVQAEQGQLSESRINQLATQRSISWKQANSLKKIINGAERQDIRDAKTLIRNAFVPNPLDPTTRAGNQRRAEVESQLILEEREARLAGKPLDVVSRAQELIGARQKQEDVIVLEQNRAALRKLLEQNGVRYDENMTDADLKRAGVTNTKTLQRINRLLNAIREGK